MAGRIFMPLQVENRSQIFKSYKLSKSNHDSYFFRWV